MELWVVLSALSWKSSLYCGKSCFEDFTKGFEYLLYQTAVGCENRHLVDCDDCKFEMHWEYEKKPTWLTTETHM